MQYNPELSCSRGYSYNLKQNKLVAVMLILALLTTTVAGIVMISDYNSSSLIRDNRVTEPISELSDSYQEGVDTVIQVGDVTLTISIIDPMRHLLMVYEIDGQKSMLEFIVSVEETGKYETSIFIDGNLRSLQTLDNNILAPISISHPDTTSQLASVQGISGLTSQYTYSWWDGVRQVTGPLYLIKYHHPDKTYYQIAKWQTVVLTGYRTTHTQFSDSVSASLIIGGWPVIFGTIGAAFGGAAGALFGGVLGALFGFITSATLPDEDSCIWSWLGLDFSNWFVANAWWLVWNPLGWGATMGAFLKIGYLRVGSYTFWDAPAIGNP
jgi:hypothetical protein